MKLFEPRESENQMTGRIEDPEFDAQSGDEQAQIEPIGREDSIDSSLAEELEDATLEPAARIEASGDFIQAEAIEAALTELVDTTQESAAEGSKRSFGQESDDPGQHYSGVQMAQGEVQSEQDWNESGDVPSTRDTGGSQDGGQRAVAGDADDGPLEEISSAVSQAIAHAILDQRFRDRLLESPDTVLDEHGLTRDDLPGLNDLNKPEADSLLRDIQRRVVEAVSQDGFDPGGSIQSPDSPSDDAQLLQFMIQQASQQHTTSLSSQSSIEDVFDKIIKNLVANLK